MQQQILSQRAHRDSGAAFLGFLRGVFLVSLASLPIGFFVLAPLYAIGILSLPAVSLLAGVLAFFGILFACWSGISAGSRLVGPCPHCGCETHARGPQGSCETCRKTFRVVGTSFSPV